VKENIPQAVGKKTMTAPKSEFLYREKKEKKSAAFP